MTKDVFSDYEIDKQCINFNNEETAHSLDCLGSCTQALESRTITKKCRGVVAKTRTVGTGNGTLKESLHIPQTVLVKAFGLTHDTLKTDVQAYGQLSRHEEFALTQHVIDEDGDEKYKCFPRCIVKDFPEDKTENGSEEVAEREIEIALMPDEHGFCMYEVILTESNKTEYKDWMENWKYSLVELPTV